MKVKELIRWLKEQDQEAEVGIYDYGQDSGDWTGFRKPKHEWEHEDLYPNLKLKLSGTKDD